jgi:hypothetical protein
MNDRTMKAGPPTGMYITQMKRMRTFEIYIRHEHRAHLYFNEGLTSAK